MFGHREPAVVTASTTRYVSLKLLSYVATKLTGKYRTLGDGRILSVMS